MTPPKAPSQAGKFKPLQRPIKKPVGDPTASVPPTRPTDSGHASGRHQEGRGDRPGRPTMSRGGRPGRGGRARGGRFTAPTGAAFFTGISVDSGGRRAGKEVGVASSLSADKMAMLKMSLGKVADNAAESMMAAARAKLGEGEEIVVAELEPDDVDGEDGKKKDRVLDRPSRYGMASLFDDENEGNSTTLVDHGNSAGEFVYDSDSSEDDRRWRTKQHANSNSFSNRDTLAMAPTRLPFPMTSFQHTPMYACQEDEIIEEKKEEKRDSREWVPSSSDVLQASSLELNDPPMRSPFLDLSSLSTSEEAKHLEQNSWFLMKFPTRLPHLTHTSFTSSLGHSKKTPTHLNHKNVSFSSLVKTEVTEDGVEHVGSSTDVGLDSLSAIDAGSPFNGHANSTGGLGFDDTLKDIAPGKYGTIVIYKSGRTELVLGGDDDETGKSEVRMLIHEGLHCSFRQEAVSIDPEEATFVPLGNVTKSLVVTPDVEKAFVLS